MAVTRYNANRPALTNTAVGSDIIWFVIGEKRSNSPSSRSSGARFVGLRKEWPTIAWIIAIAEITPASARLVTRNFRRSSSLRINA